MSIIPCWQRATAAPTRRWRTDQRRDLRHRRRDGGHGPALRPGAALQTRPLPRARPARRLRRAGHRPARLGGAARHLPGVSLLIAVFGMYWDISLHIDQGRDPGPLANPAHYFILVGLFGIFVAGLLAMALPEREARAATAVRIAPRLVRAARRRADPACGALLAARLPARRHLAPALRPGRDALGPDPPDADRRRRRCRCSAAWSLLVEGDARAARGREPRRAAAARDRLPRDAPRRRAS